MTAIDTDVAPPEVKKKHRARRKRTEVINPAAMLVDALKFISIAQKKTGEVKQQFCFMAGHWLAASDGILTVATKIEEDLQACPHSYQLADALSKIGETVSITQLSQTFLTVTSGAFKAVVPCVDPSELSIPAPDPRCAALDDCLKPALEAACMFVVDGAPVAMHAAVLLQAGSCVGTNGHGLVEAWHGIDLPPGLLVPRAAALAVAKCSKKLIGFGFSQSSATFYFEDESFIKTQLFLDRYPYYQAVFEDVEMNPWPLPEEFYKAVKAVESFNRHGHVYFMGGQVLSNLREYEASTYKMDALPDYMGFSAKYLNKVESYVKTVQFDKPSNKMFFFGDNVRGAIMGLDLRNREEKPQPETRNDDNPHNGHDYSQNHYGDNSDIDEDVPF